MCGPNELATISKSLVSPSPEVAADDNVPSCEFSDSDISWSDWTDFPVNEKASGTSHPVNVNTFECSLSENATILQQDTLQPNVSSNQKSGRYFKYFN